MDSGSHPQSAVKPMRVQQREFLGVLWGGLAIAFICCCLRFLARAQTFKKLLADDYFVVSALVFAIANAITWQIHIGDLYYIMNVAAGLELPGPDFVSKSQGYFKSTVAVIILFYSSLWSIKISFLLLFKRLGTNVRHQKVLWWPVFGFTLATYFACIGSIQYPCLVRSFEYLAANCATPSAISFQQVTLKLNCAWDVITDFLIMSIPITMLWGVQMKWQRKVALAGIFSLVIITMTFAIVRTAVVGSATSLPDSSWLYLWSSIETSVAIIVACLASFRNLFSRENSRNSPKRYEPPNSSNVFLRGSKSRSRMRHLIETLGATSNDPHSSYQVQIDSGNDTRSMIDLRSDSHSPSKPHQAVHVRKDVDLVHESSVV